MLPLLARQHCHVVSSPQPCPSLSLVLQAAAKKESSSDDDSSEEDSSDEVRGAAWESMVCGWVGAGLAGPGACFTHQAVLRDWRFEDPVVSQCLSETVPLR